MLGQQARKVFREQQVLKDYKAFKAQRARKVRPEMLGQQVRKVFRV